MKDATASKPAVGDNILINHRSDGEGRFVGCTPEITKVTAVYLDGDVRVGSGDVYKAVRISHKDAGWGTENPNKKQKRG